jgi:hypothetical protein
MVEGWSKDERRHIGVSDCQKKGGIHLQACPIVGFLVCLLYVSLPVSLRALAIAKHPERKQPPRNVCLTHMAAQMMRQGIPEKMIKAALKDLAGHVMDQTLEGYLHLATPKSAVVRSPIEDL